MMVRVTFLRDAVPSVQKDYNYHNLFLLVFIPFKNAYTKMGLGSSREWCVIDGPHFVDSINKKLEKMFESFK